MQRKIFNLDGKYLISSEAMVHESLRTDEILRENAAYLAAADTKIALKSVGFTHSRSVKELAIRALALNKA